MSTSERFYRPAGAPIARTAPHINTDVHQPMRGFCPVCGHGREELPDGWWMTVPQVLIYLELDWMWYEYVCPRCYHWAVRAGAKWDGDTIGSTGFKLNRLYKPRYKPAITRWTA